MIDQLANAVAKTVKQFQDNPTHFLSERDIQALLFVELRNATTLRHQYDAGGANRKFKFTDPIRIHPITTEYYLYDKGKRDRFDIAVLSEEQDSKSDIWRQPCCIGIEIKLWQPGYKDCEYRKDVEKLQRYQQYLQKDFAPRVPSWVSQCYLSIPTLSKVSGRFPRKILELLILTTVLHCTLLLKHTTGGMSSFRLPFRFW